jgi:hypothetical protein
MNGTLSEAFDLFNRGEKQQAAKLLAALVIQEPNNASAWYGLALCLDDPDKVKYCLQKVLGINPNHSKARQMIDKLSERAGTKVCPYCQANIQEEIIICTICGSILVGKSSSDLKSSYVHSYEQQPYPVRKKKQSFPSTVKWNIEGILSSKFVEGAIIIVVLIGVIGALVYAFYQMDIYPLEIPESIVYNPDPSNTSGPLTATPGSSSQAGTADNHPSSITTPYFEDFSDGSGIWNIRDDAEVSFIVSDGKYIIKPKQPGGAWWTSPQADLDNIRLEFTTIFMYEYPLEDGGLRVNFRCVNSDEEICYRMFVSENGYLYVHRGEDTLVEHKLSQYIRLYDHPNHWAIVMDGSNFEIYCNDELLSTFSDSKYESGDFGFGVLNSENDQWGFNGVAFDDIRVSSLD